MTTKEKTSTIILTENAAEAVAELIQDRGLEDYGLRVFVAGGGCSGFQYGMSLDNTLIENDTIIESHGVKVFIDDASMEFLQGATIDFVNSEMGSGFQIDNPNPLPASSCGCGSDSKAAASSCSCGGSCNCGC